MNDIDAAEGWLDAWVEQLKAQAARGVELWWRVAELTGSAEGRDGAIRVMVGSTGQVERLKLDVRVYEFSGPRLAEEVRDTVGADTEMGRDVIHAFRHPVSLGRA